MFASEQTLGKASLTIRNPEADAQRLASQAMTESEERFRQLAASVSDVFWMYEPQRDRFLYVSPAYEREWMRSAKALYVDPHEWLSPVHSDDRKCLQDAFDHLADGDSYALEYRVTTRARPAAACEDDQLRAQSWDEAPDITLAL